MDTKQFILNKLIASNPVNEKLKIIKLKDFDISKIEKIPEVSKNNVLVNSRLRFNCNIKDSKKWVGSKLVYLYRYDASNALPEQSCFFHIENLPAKVSDIAEFVFSNMNLEFDSSWIKNSNEVINKPTEEFPDITITIKIEDGNCPYFYGLFNVKIKYNKEPIDYLERYDIETFKPLLEDNDTRTHLTPYSFDFINSRSTLVGWDKIVNIKSQNDLKNNFKFIIDLISELSGETWSTIGNTAENRPGGYFKFFYNGELTKEKIDGLFGTDSFMPINKKYNKALILHLDCPNGSQSKYVGHLFIYYQE